MLHPEQQNMNQRKRFKRGVVCLEGKREMKLPQRPRQVSKPKNKKQIHCGLNGARRREEVQKREQIARFDGIRKCEGPPEKIETDWAGFGILRQCLWDLIF